MTFSEILFVKTAPQSSGQSLSQWRLFASLIEAMLSNMKLHSSSWGPRHSVCTCPSYISGLIVPICCMRHIFLLHKIRNSSWDGNSRVMFPSITCSMILLAAVSSHKQTRKDNTLVGGCNSTGYFTWVTETPTQAQALQGTDVLGGETGFRYGLIEWLNNGAQHPFLPSFSVDLS